MVPGAELAGFVAPRICRPTEITLKPSQT